MENLKRLFQNVDLKPWSSSTRQNDWSVRSHIFKKHQLPTHFLVLETLYSKGDSRIKIWLIAFATSGICDHGPRWLHAVKPIQKTAVLILYSITDAGRKWSKKLFQIISKNIQRFLMPLIVASKRWHELWRSSNISPTFWLQNPLFFGSYRAFLI